MECKDGMAAHEISIANRIRILGNYGRRKLQASIGSVLGTTSGAKSNEQHPVTSAVTVTRVAEGTGSGRDTIPVQDMTMLSTHRIRRWSHPLLQRLSSSSASSTRSASSPHVSTLSTLHRKQEQTRKTFNGRRRVDHRSYESAGQFSGEPARNQVTFFLFFLVQKMIVLFNGTSSENWGALLLMSGERGRVRRLRASS